MRTQRWVASVFLVWGMLACIGFAAVAEAGMGMAVAPSHFRFRQMAGETASGKVRVDNKAHYPIQVTTEVTDMLNRRNAQGGLTRDEAPTGTTPYSCARWIQLVQGAGTIIQPGGSATVEFLVSPPPDVESGSYAAFLFFLGTPASMAEPEDTGLPQVRVVTVPRLGVSVFFEVEGAIRRTGELLNLEYTVPTSTQPLSFRYEFKNTGNADIRLTGSFHILDAEGNLVGKGGTVTLHTFPGGGGIGETSWKGEILPGHYTLLVTFELGPNATEAIVRELEFDVLVAE